jgi:hypothetical protein
MEELAEMGIIKANSKLRRIINVNSNVRRRIKVNSNLRNLLETKIGRKIKC